jgi:hypothetical protein
MYLEAEISCFKDFPDQCEGCSEYHETIQNFAEQASWLAGAGFYPQPLLKVVKECRAFHKRKVEYQR